MSRVRPHVSASRAAVLGLAMALAVPRVASASSLELAEGLELDLGARLYIQETTTEEGVASLNPRNDVAELPRARGVALALAALRLEWGLVEAKVEPRALVDAGWLVVGAEHGTIAAAELWLQEATLALELPSGLRIAGGRYDFAVGPSVFLAPSNPFASGSFRLNPKIDPPTRDLVTASWASDAGWSLGAIANIGPGRDPAFDEPWFEFVRSYGLRFDVAGDAWSAIALGAVAEDGQGQLGGSAQLTVSEALLTWADVAVHRGHRSFVPVEDVYSPDGWEMASRETDGVVRFSGLAGGSYAFDGGLSVSLEYLFQGIGYSGDEAADYFRMLDELAGISIYPLTRAARRERARAINPGLSFIRRHYVMTEVRQIDAFDAGSFSVRAIYTPEDGSAQLSALVEANLADAADVFFVGFFGLGPDRSDFGRFLRRSLLVGVELRL
ncbi:hypothetical protein L6R52_11095 [Myxococcota bacterium]|nr:hypothetical protein [Myxococcota bacterium]